MIVYRYDKTFEGILTAIFDAFSRKQHPARLLSGDDIEPMFTTESYLVMTQNDRSNRVWKALEKKTSARLRNMLWSVWLSEEVGCDELIFRYIYGVFDDPNFSETNFANPDVLGVFQLAKKVGNDAHHIHMFARFQKASDDTYFAPINPKYNSLPLALDYFTDRFADQKWVVYDMQRRYGFYYDLKTVVEITLDSDADHLITGKLDENLMAEDEKMFQELWRNYFNAMTIKERINLKLQRQHMPKRFWKYLTEKQ